MNSVSIAPSGTRFGFVLRDTFGEPDNVITVIDFALSDPVQFPLRSPELDGGGLNTVQFADAMDFTADGRYLAYDALNTFQLLDGTASAVWSIYALDLQTETTLVLLPPQPGVNFAFPNFSQTSDNFLTFDAVSDATGQSTIVAANLNTGELSEIATVDGLGVPGYTGDDAAIVFSQEDARVNTGFSLVRQPLASDRISPVGEPALWLEDGDAATIYRRGIFVGPPTRTPTIPFVPPTSTPTRTIGPTRTLPPPGPCIGDCDSDGAVSIAELIRGVNIALGNRPIGDCRRFDSNDDGTVTINELIQAVRAALAGCI